ncbi:L-lysine 2-3-aminomutase [Penicillium cf. griseofulvum]|uniref:L-lysine 2-3-aminomutase n=1 Tax=Penicillium cf. griseofulvum TaxID=2972120 RepID=A0A9W9T5E5_9EURO|nr:L-lysine 2-3-aminomutase [Penicillium cf. griseofulvum]
MTRKGWLCVDANHPLSPSFSPSLYRTHSYYPSRTMPRLVIPNLSRSIILSYTYPDTYDHRVWKTGLPVRSAVLKPHAGELVVGWVTTSESSLLYVFAYTRICLFGRLSFW